MSFAVIVRDELGKLIATRRGWLALLGFALLWGGVLAYLILPVARTLDDADAAGLREALLSALGLAGLADWSAPQLAVYWLLALYLLPPFAVLVAADQTASDLARGTLRFHALRASRATLFLGRFAAQCLVQLGLVLVTLASVLVVLAVQAPERLPDAFAASPAIILALLVSLLPFVALMALCSALARTPRQATLFAVIGWVAVSIVLDLVRERLGAEGPFEHVLPGSESAILRTLSGTEVLSRTGPPLLQTLVLLAIGLFVFSRRRL